MSKRPRFRTVAHRPSWIRAASLGAALLLILALMIPARSTQAQSSSSEVVSWVHIGDLHMVDTTLSNYSDLKTIVSDINRYLKGGVNFVYLPGDNANDGATSEYQLVNSVTKGLQVPLRAIPGDHDNKGNIADFEQYIYPKNPDSFDVGNYHFVLLDSFKLSNQLSYLTSSIQAASRAGKQSVIMWHEFDVNQCCTAAQSLIQQDHVILVDTGHTHSNVLANDGHTIYAATRSTGQATEGPVGFSLESLDRGIVSWRFQPLGQWPFASITSPADQGLLINGDQVVKGATTIHVKAFSNATIKTVSYQIDGGAKVAMSDRGNSLWSASWSTSSVSNGAHTVSVTVTDANGKTGTDQIKALVNQSGSYSAPTRSFGPEGNTLPTDSAKGLLGGAGGGHGGAKGGHGPAPCATAAPTTNVTPTTAKSGHGSGAKGGHGCGAPGAKGGHGSGTKGGHGSGAKGGQGPGAKGGHAGKGASGKHGHGGKSSAPCSISSSATPTATTATP